MNDTLDALVASIKATNEEWNKYSDMLRIMETLVSNDGLFGHLDHPDEEDLLDKLTDAYDDAEEYDSVF